MRPLTVITGILLGTSASIAVSLAAVLLIFMILGDDYPRLQHEFWPLVHSVLIFLGMTAISALSFYALLINDRRWAWAQALMWLGLFGTGWFYWP